MKKTFLCTSYDKKFTKSLSYAVLLSVFFKTNLKTYAVLLSVFLVLKMKKTFLCTSYDKKFTKSLQEVYKKFTKSLSYTVFLSVFLSQLKKEDAFVCFARRKVYEKCTKGVRKMPKRIKVI